MFCRYLFHYIKASKTPVFLPPRQDTFWKTISDKTKITDFIHSRETFRLTKEENAPSKKTHRLIKAMSCENTSMVRHVKSKYLKEQYSQ